MDQTIRYLAKLFLFWLLLFAFNRAIFLLVQYSAMHTIIWADIFRAFRYALPLDSSAACYSCGLPFLWLWVTSLLRRGYNPVRKESKAWTRILKAIVYLSIFLHNATAYGEAALYTEWHTKLSWDALSHFTHPSEVFKSASWSLTILFSGCLMAFSLLFFYLYRRFVHIHKLPFLSGHRQKIMTWALYFPITGFVIFTGIRGGWKRFPISQSITYFSPHAVLNDAAVNAGWNLIHNVTEAAKGLDENPYHWLPAKEATTVVDSLYHFKRDTTTTVLTTDRPNVVLFLLESWSSDALQVPGHPEIMPVFDSLIQQGIYFDQCYAAGHISDQGIPATLSAIPNTGNISVCSEPKRTIHLPALSEMLDSVGYHTGFFYGGQLDFGNIQSYVFNKKFARVKSGRDFSSSLPRTALGVPDGIMADQIAQLISQEQQPFFYCWYTLSTHMPYDIPAPKWITFGGKERPFVNTMHYADSSLGLFFQKVKDEPWYKNTLFIFVSDHSHDTPYDRVMQDKDRHRIPLLFFGDVIRPEWRGKTLHRISSQLDIAATLLGQMNLPQRRYPWSKNLFNPYAPQFAAINYGSGSGFITPEGFVSLDDRFPDFLLTDMKDSTQISKLKRLNQAFQQESYNEFLKW